MITYYIMTSVSSLTKLRNASAFLFFASNRLSRLLDIVISLICKILSFTNASFLSVTWTLQKNKRLREYAQVSICMTIVGSTETPHTIQNHPKPHNTTATTTEYSHTICKVSLRYILGNFRFRVKASVELICFQTP